MKRTWIDSLPEGFNKELIRAEEERYMRKRKHRIHKAIFVAIVGFVLVFILLFLATGCSKVSADGKETTVESVVVTVSEKEYYPKETGNIRMKIVSSDGPVHVRYNPNLSNKEKTLVDLENGTEFYVSALYMEGEFLGFPADSYHTSFVKDIEDSDGIFWVYSYYCKAERYNYMPENAPEVKNLGIMDVEDSNIIGLKIHGNPRVRSTPTTKDDGNIYGRLLDTTIIVESFETIKIDECRVFYGVPAHTVEAYLYDESYGAIYYDNDGILWISVDYAEPVYKN